MGVINMEEGLIGENQNYSETKRNRILDQLIITAKEE